MPSVNHFCKTCGEATNWTQVPERKKTRQCKECHIADSVLANSLFTCMTCEERRVVSSKETDCKKCRVKKMPVPYTRNARFHKKDTFDTSPSGEDAIRNLENR